MNPSKRRSGYGILDLRHQVARRIQREWEMVETPTPRSWPKGPDAFARPSAPPPPPPAPPEKRPLAA